MAFAWSCRGGVFRAAFGLFFILIANTSDDSGLLPLVAARVASISVLLVVVRSLRGTIWIKPAAVKPMAGAGFLDITANALFLLAARAGSLPVAAVLSSSLPGVDGPAGLERAGRADQPETNRGLDRRRRRYCSDRSRRNLTTSLQCGVSWLS